MRPHCFNPFYKLLYVYDVLFSIIIVIGLIIF